MHRVNYNKRKISQYRNNLNNKKNTFLLGTKNV